MFDAAIHSDQDPQNHTKDHAKILIYVVEDHANLRRLLVNYINHEANLQVIGQAASAIEALSDSLAYAADVIISDLSMPEMNGIELTHRLHEKNPDILIMLLTAINDSIFIEKAFDAGASAYVLKDNPFLIKNVILRILAGEKTIIEIG